MGTRILSLLAVLVLVAGCSSSPEDTGSVSTDMAAPVATSAMPSAPVEPVGAVPGSQQDLVVNVGDRVFFGYDKFDISADAKTTLEKQANWLKQYANVKIIIEGHCDERGTREYNLALGEKRAMAAKNYLIALGIDASRIQTISYGKERPAVAGSDEAAWAQNRRAVSVVQ